MDCHCLRDLRDRLKNLSLSVKASNTGIKYRYKPTKYARVSLTRYGGFKYLLVRSYIAQHKIIL